MTTFAAFEPRDPALARRVLVTFTGVATAVTVVFAVVNAHGPQWGLSGSLAALIITAGFAVAPTPPAWQWMAVPAGATVMIAVLDLATSDASVSAQMFFVFPALYGGAQLPRSGAGILCGAAVALDAVVNWVLLAPNRALINMSSVAAVLVTATFILLLSAERVSALIDQLHQLAAIDSLTGLVTRRVLDEAATASLQSASSDGGTALIIIDVDHFKAVNDRYGHPVGDHVLQQVALSLRSGTRRADTISRMGGDELAVLVPGCPLADAVRLAEGILERIRGLSFDTTIASTADNVGQLRVTASIGVAHLPTHAQEVHDLYRAADHALYRAKRAGRDRVAVLDSQLRPPLAS